eukprot:5953157-Prymnesium_polylepis.1
MASLGGRNELGWRGGEPLPEPPAVGEGEKPCWLLPSDDQTALLIAQMAPQLAAVGWRLLTSEEHVISRLGDKAHFHAYAAEIGMLKCLPRHYATPDAAQYPCILKAAQGEYGRDVHIVHSKADVRAIASGGFGSEWLLQELIAGTLEQSTSLLLKGGIIHDAITSTYTYAEAEYVYPHVKELTAERISTRDVVSEHLDVMRAFLGGYQGICNFNYKVRDDGSMAIFEINTRMGADLACDMPAQMLRGLMRTLDETIEPTHCAEMG